MYAQFILIVVGYIVWHLSQKFISYLHRRTYIINGNKGVIFDGIHESRLFLCANNYLFGHPKFTELVFILSASMLDVTIIGFVIRYLISGMLRPIICLVVCSTLRQVCQVLCHLPLPKKIIAIHPRFPSLFVTYDIIDDLFFSGHTATSIVLGLELLYTSHFALHIYAYFFIIYEILFVLVTRNHYFMDVYAGGVTGGLVFMLVTKFM